MGVRLVGLNPSSDKGMYLRVGDTNWEYLAPLCQGVAPAITASWIKTWGAREEPLNNGLDHTYALQLATVLATLPQDLKGWGDTVDHKMVGGRQLIHDFVDFLKDSGGFSIC